MPFSVPGFGAQIPIDIVYWAGTAIIAIFVLGACNASNLIDGLVGLATGVTAIAAAGLLVIALTLAMLDDGPRDAQRVILCLALLGACLGFLPHNFNPATIFLGDCGSLLLGFCSIVIVLTLGDNGFTYLVIAGLVIYAVPILDTVLAIIRRKMAGRSISDPDDQHLHHMLKRALGVRGAVLTLYGIGAVFAVLGVTMSLFRARVVYAIALVAFSFLIVTAVKMARRKALDEQAEHYSRTAPVRRREPTPTAPLREESPPVY
jgi:UDP-GlcNAc:undecaprenyl-phosphate GlcNAc-1-phosphate transferase